VRREALEASKRRKQENGGMSRRSGLRLELTGALAPAKRKLISKQRKVSGNSEVKRLVK
jgi:hypothetical protein